MAKITEHFTTEEFGIPVDTFQTKRIECSELAEALEDVRRIFAGHPIRITSGYRTVEEQKRVNPDAPNSFHPKGMAADIQVMGWTPEQVFLALSPIWEGGLGVYDTHVHIDVRYLESGSIPARWDKRTSKSAKDFWQSGS